MVTARNTRASDAVASFEIIPPEQLQQQLVDVLGRLVTRREFTKPFQSGVVVFFDHEALIGCPFWRPEKGHIQFYESGSIVDFMAGAKDRDWNPSNLISRETSANEFMRYYRMAWNVRNPALAAPSAPAYPRLRSGTRVGY